MTLPNSRADHLILYEHVVASKSMSKIWADLVIPKDVLNAICIHEISITPLERNSIPNNAALVYMKQCGPRATPSSFKQKKPTPNALLPVRS